MSDLVASSVEAADCNQLNTPHLPLWWLTVENVKDFSFRLTSMKECHKYTFYTSQSSTKMLSKIQSHRASAASSCLG